MFGVSVNTIIWSNDIKRGNLISTGQTLVILPMSGIKYTIEKGDSVAGIAKKFSGDSQEIIEFNNLPTDGSLAIGEEIFIPNGTSPVVQSSGTYASSYSVRGSSAPVYSGYYLRPISGGRKSQGLHGYNAVDLAVSCGTPIVASASGDVTVSRNYGWNGGYGRYIVISHNNGTQTLYSHLSRNIVSNGWHVVQGQVIGYIGSTGRSTGCHVHFEIRGARNSF
jgi:murein DD-endopeptidase MepM/ murein hydrolase activator NlpD